MTARSYGRPTADTAGAQQADLDWRFALRDADPADDPTADTLTEQELHPEFIDAYLARLRTLRTGTQLSFPVATLATAPKGN
jgi:hypothetical protein